MLAAAEKHLSQWAKDVLRGVEVLFDTPGEASSQRSVVCFTLLQLTAAPKSACLRDRAVGLDLQYLVTTQAKSISRAGALLAELLVAAMGSPVLRVTGQQPPPALWQGFGLAPRPSLVVELPVTIERPQPSAKPVLEPLVVRYANLEPLEGVVLGPNDTPLPGVVVELPALSLRTRTDLAGRFRLEAVPAREGSEPFSLRVAGRQIDLPAGQKPVAVRLDSREE